MAKPTRSTAHIAQALSGIDFPCHRRQIIEYARRNNADEEALDVLVGMPDERYESMSDVFKGVILSPGYGRSPPQPIQPEREEGRGLPTEPPAPEGLDEAAHPHATQLPPQPQPQTEQAAKPQRDERRRAGLLRLLRRRLGLE